MTTRSNIRFKTITSQQSVLFPSNLSDKIATNHPVRIVNKVVDSLNIDDILSTYKGGGTSSYHPRVMIKILFYSYLNNTYSCRKIARQLEENIHYMWLSGDITPNFRTINNFRSQKLKNQIRNLFSELVKLMVEMGYVSLDTQYIDGTKIEAASNRYTFVWRKSVEKYKEKLEVKVASVLKDIDASIDSDVATQDESDEFKAIDSSELEQRIALLNERIEELNKQQQKQVKQLKEDALPRLKKYERQLDTLGDRNSYSKTDPDATFMRMKEDHMKNGQLKPAYNVQISTENQILTNFSMHQRAGDPATFIPHIEQFNQFYNKYPEVAVADSGYGSEQNYKYAENQEIEAFIKYNYFHKEQKKAYKKNPFLTANLFYNPEGDFLICPMGQRMNKVGTARKVSDLGYISLVSIYQAQNCHGCPLKSGCHKSKYNRRIEINHELNRLRKTAREKLLSETGVYHRGKRPIEPEAVFGHIKYNNKFNRFSLKGLEKVEIEFGLVAIAHNLRKMVSIMAKNRKYNSFYLNLLVLNTAMDRIIEIFKVESKCLTKTQFAA